MQIDDQLINYLSDLSRLRLTAEEHEDTKENLAKILGHMEQLVELDPGGVEALSHPFPTVNCFREDAVTPSADRDVILASAPRSKDGCYQVPKTVE